MGRVFHGAYAGADRIIRFGPAFFTISLAFFGMQHFALFDVVRFAVPPWMPWTAFWTYFVERH
jgi:uncharacterized membrane protein